MNKKRRPRKNVVIDIRPPRGSSRFSTASPYFSEGDIYSRPKLEFGDRFKILKVLILSILIIGVLAVSSYAFYLWNYKDDAFSSGLKIYDSFKLAAESLLDLETDKTAGFIDLIKEEIDKIGYRIKPLEIVPFLNEAPGALGLIKDVAEVVASLNTEIAILKEDGADMLFSDDG
ncbi:MAG TPA: hypothetical protein VI432_02665, partial [Candidatus Paceibacterota bacterium]